MLAILVALSACSATGADEPVRLTTDGTLKLAPVFVDKGDEVVFATHEVPNLVAIVRLKLSDGSRRRVHPTVVNHQFDPAFSRDGRLHAYARSSTSPQMVLVIQDTHDKKESVFRPRESRATVRNPSFAPDGSRVVFSLSDVGGHQIDSVNTQAQDLKPLTDAAGMNAWPAYSPDGRKIAFGSSRTGDFEIYVMNADGSDTRSPDAKPRARRPPRLVSRWNSDRLHEQPRRKLRDLRHERRRIEPAQRRRRTPPATTMPPGTPTGVCSSFPIETAAPTFTSTVMPQAQAPRDRDRTLHTRGEQAHERHLEVPAP